MGKIIVDEDKLDDAIREAIGSVFFNKNNEVAYPFDQFAEYFIIETGEELLDNIVEKIKNINEG